MISRADRDFFFDSDGIAKVMLFSELSSSFCSSPFDSCDFVIYRHRLVLPLLCLRWGGFSVLLFYSWVW